MFGTGNACSGSLSLEGHSESSSSKILEVMVSFCQIAHIKEGSVRHQKAKQEGSISGHIQSWLSSSLVCECRPDWQKFMRGPKEGAKGYQARLRQSFSFTQSEVLPEEGLKSRDQAKQLSMMQGKISKVKPNPQMPFK